MKSISNNNQSGRNNGIPSFSNHPSSASSNGARYHSSSSSAGQSSHGPSNISNHGFGSNSSSNGIGSFPPGYGGFGSFGYPYSSGGGLWDPFAANMHWIYSINQIMASFSQLLYLANISSSSILTFVKSFIRWLDHLAKLLRRGAQQASVSRIMERYDSVLRWVSVMLAMFVAAKIVVHQQNLRPPLLNQVISK
jgi:hypothetical protein